MKKILYIEDDAINAFVIMKLLGKEYSVVHKEGGEEGLHLLSEEKVDLVLMDINLGNGKMDGIEAMKRIKANLKGLPVVAVTSYALPEDKDRFLSEGFDDYIPKPVDRSTLLLHVQKFL